MRDSITVDVLRVFKNQKMGSEQIAKVCPYDAHGVGTLTTNMPLSKGFDVSVS